MEIFRRFRREKTALAGARRLYDAVVRRARARLFHTRLGVADSIDGRFDLLVLHLYLVLDALRQEGEAGGVLGKALTNLAFDAFEEALRELGVTDQGMARRIKKMANAFYGRIDAYVSAGENQTGLADALLRNIYRGDRAREPEAAMIARYVIAARDGLAKDSARRALLQGEVDFEPLPEFSHTT
jgi:cytochrome b pre-mRNA-processing protein 3